MNARMFTQNLISAAIGGLAVLSFTGSPLSAQNSAVTPTSPANSTPADMSNHHQQMMSQMQEMMSQMQQMMEQCKSKMSQGTMGSGNAHTGAQPGQHGQGSTNHSSN